MVCPPFCDGAVGHAAVPCFGSQHPGFCSWLFRNGSWVLFGVSFLSFFYLSVQNLPKLWHAHGYF